MADQQPDNQFYDADADEAQYDVEPEPDEEDQSYRDHELGSAEEVDDSQERVLTEVRPAMFRAHPFRTILIVVLMLGGAALAVIAGFQAVEGVPLWLMWPGIVIAALAWLWWMIWYLDTRLSVRLRVTNKRTIHSVGLLSRNTSEVLHTHIRNIRIDQSFMQRVFNTGRLRIDSSAGGGDNVEIEMADVPSPHELKEMIDPYRKL